MHFFSIMATLLFLIFLASCKISGKKQEPSLLSYFKSVPSGDTLLFEVSENDEPVAGDTIPNPVFFSHVSAGLMNDIEYLDDSGEAKFIGRLRFPLAENIEACLVDIRQNWFQHQSLFLFNQEKQAFTDRVTVAEWYGGEGGQILTGSWLLDFDSDGDKDLVRREIEHWLIMDGEEPRDTMIERGALLLWKDGKFSETPVKDSTALVRDFPIRSFW